MRRSLLSFHCTDKVFHGNPAAICILDHWLFEKTMMDITIENNLSETAFAVKNGDVYHLRWFTPGGEIDLCGHATLACAFVLLNYYEKDAEKIDFDTLSGRLTVTRHEDLLEMDFPAYELKCVEVTEEMTAAIGAKPKEAYMGRDLLCVFDDAEMIPALAPDQEKVRNLDGLLLHVTARGVDVDCVSRTFAPKCGVAEDPVCGSGHCHIIPYWSQVLIDRISSFTTRRDIILQYSWRSSISGGKSMPVCCVGTFDHRIKHRIEGCRLEKSIRCMICR